MSGVIEKLDRDAAHEKVDDLRSAMRGLRSTLSFLQTGAHPDDETSGLLALLVRKHGLAVGYACATRGEGGQNAIGPERNDALGYLRTAEMYAAARILGVSLFWLGGGPGDPVRDFGFSKNAEDTFERWGEQRILERLVRRIRQERVDILCPTFRDVAGQHGHHRAMTRATRLAFELAGNPDVFPGHVAEGIDPWTPSLLYVPAWSGAGSTYDDEESPPTGHVHFDLGECDPGTGTSYAHIGECSRARHRTQQMGEWLESGPRPVALHLLAHRGASSGVPIDRIGQDMPFDLREWGQLAGGKAARALLDAQEAIDEAYVAMATGVRVELPLVAALRAVRAAAQELGVADRAQIAHRLALKERQLCRAIWRATDRIPELSFAPTFVSAGGAVRATLSPASDEVAAKIRAPEWFTRTADPESFVARFGGPSGTPMDASYRPLGGGMPFGAVVAKWHDGQRLEIEVDPSTMPAIVDARSRRVAYPHLPELALPGPEEIRFADIRFVRPKGARIAFFDGGLDSCGQVLRQLGFDIVRLESTAELEGNRFESVLVGSRAFETLDRLSGDPEALHRYVRQGGNLVTLYQRPGPWWTSTRTPLAAIEIGSPSFRWRVCRPDAEAFVRLPEHQLLNRPNKIAAEDWAGWRRERGLYFASSWDPAYEAPVAFSDPGEAALAGGILSGRFGRGRHTHVALALHNEIAFGTPGAIRLLCNILVPEDSG